MTYILTSYIIYMILAYYGVTKGMHAYWSHKAFKAGVWYEWTSLIAALFVGVYKPIGWVGIHRLHHRYSDTPKDPHLVSFWPNWSGVKVTPSVVKDVIRNPRMRFFERYGKYMIWGVLLISPLTVIIGFFSLAIFNRFSHQNGKAVNRFWLNIFTPGEGRHEDHHYNTFK